VITRQALKYKLHHILETIEQAAQSCGRRGEDVQLVAATKVRTVDELNWFQEEILAVGRSAIFGENYVQEFRSKVDHLTGSFQTHLIGHLQSNKSREALKLFDVIESVDSLKLAKVLAKEAITLCKAQVIYLQVNISSDSNKGGFALEELENFIEKELPLLNMIQVAGLMTITANYNNPEEVRRDYRCMRQVRDKLVEKYPEAFARELCHLSMGMSDDYRIAIEEGATTVRIGSALFGSRT
jgi:PLP dependent protein